MATCLLALRSLKCQELRKVTEDQNAVRSSKQSARSEYMGIGDSDDLKVKLTWSCQRLLKKDDTERPVQEKRIKIRCRLHL